MNSKAIKKQLLAAVAMVLVAAVALGSSTYAWFVASGTVQAKGMKVQAQSEGGILIKELNNTDMKFGTVADVAMDKGAALYPTSTANLSTWYHAVSTNADESKYTQAGSKTYAASDYESVQTNDLDEYRLVKTFAIRSATNEAITDAALAITKVEVTGGNASQNFNKAIRVGVKVSSGGADDAKFYVYTPVNTSDFTLNAGYADATALVEKVEPAADKTDKLALSADAIPANDTALTVDIFVWYEGEDPECKTSNVYSIDIDELSVSVTFEQVAK